MSGAGVAHFFGVCVEHAVVMSFAIFLVIIVKPVADFITVHFESLFRHAESARNVQGAFERLIRLKPYDFFEVFVDISRFVAVNRRNDFGIRV